MSVIQKIREMQQQAEKAKPVQVVQVIAPEEAEAKLRRKAGVLAAFGLTDKAICDTLFITLEQVAAIKETTEFKESCAQQTYERTQRLIDLEEGWDSIESMGVATVMEFMQRSRDPEFALRASLMANKATRRAPASMERVIDASKVGNVITLTVNRNYVTQITNNEGGKNHGIIETQARSSGEIPRKASDVSTPKRLQEILQIEKPRSKDQEIMRLAETVGLSLDELDELTS